MMEEDKEKIKKITSCLINAVVEQYSLVTKLAEETKDIVNKYSEEEIVNEIISNIKEIKKDIIPQNIPVLESDFKRAITNALLSLVFYYHLNKKKESEKIINGYTA